GAMGLAAGRAMAMDDRAPRGIDLVGDGTAKTATCQHDQTLHVLAPIQILPSNLPSAPGRGYRSHPVARRICHLTARGGSGKRSSAAGAYRGSRFRSRGSTL